MEEVLIHEDEELIELRNELKIATDQLLAERSAAIEAKDEAKVVAAEAEFDRIGVVLATVQGVINRNEAIKLEALAVRLKESIAAQTAAGLAMARQTLGDILLRLGRAEEAILAEREPKPEPSQPAEGTAPTTGGTGGRPPADLLRRLVTIYKGENIRHPQLRAVTLAQWMLESGRARSKLAKLHLNFGGLKWRPEMAPFATKVSFEAHDGVDNYCKFATIENFINGYWAFLNRAPYSGWEEQVGSASSFIRFIGPIYTPSAGYADKVLNLLAEAAVLLEETTAEPAAVESVGGAVDLGTIVIDPGHGGTSNVPGSSANNAIAKSGVKEKKLTLDCALLLRSELLNQAAKAGERINVVLTRTTDVNVTGAKRAGTAFLNNAKLFLSIHFNGGAAATRGTETFFRATENKNLNLQDDMAFAQDVQDAVLSAIKALDDKAVDRGIKPDTQTNPGSVGVLNDRLLGNDRRPDPCRAALVEIEFISNTAADKLLVSGPDAVANRTKVMSSLAKRLRKHMKDMGGVAIRAVPLAGDVVQKLEQQIAAGKIIFDAARLEDELLGRSGDIRVTRKLQSLVLSLSELVSSRIRISSLVRAGTDSHHGSGRAVDIGNEEIAAALLPVVATDAKVTELGIDELIFDAALAGHDDRNKWNYDQGIKHSFGAATLNDHGNHIHFAVKA